MVTVRSRIEWIVSCIVTVHPHELFPLIHSFACFFFILTAYFVVLPLRDEGAISLGLSNLPGLFAGSLVLTLVAAPISTVIFSLPYLSKGKALLIIHRFFSGSLVLFFILLYATSFGSSPSVSKVLVSQSIPTVNYDGPNHSASSGSHGWFFISVRISLFLWVALLNLVTISSTWARVIDVMDNESGSRLFGFVGAGATLGQLFGSLFAIGMARLGPFLLLFAALMMELAAQSSKGITRDILPEPKELSFIGQPGLDEHVEVDKHSKAYSSGSSPRSSVMMPPLYVIFDGLRLIVGSTYLIHISAFLWLSAVVSSFFYLQKVTIIATTVASSLDRRRMFAQINSFIAIFILTGQLTVTGHILTVAGVTAAICATPLVALFNTMAIALWPTWIMVAISETLRKVVTYVVTRPGRELLFTVVSQDEKYKAKVCIDVIVQRLGDATAAGIYKLLVDVLHKKASTVALYAVPVCLLWMVTAFYLGRRQSHLFKYQSVPTS
ncbi:hypothetical protein AMTRI_Chr08g209260 [Amborella trichopoda]